MSETVECSSCGALLVGESPYDEERQPCFVCGALSRDMSMKFVQELNLYQEYRIKPKRQGTKPTHEQVDGFDYTSSSRKFSKIVRVVDRDNDHYYECITDTDTDKVIHECDEPLSHPFGRDSARLQEHDLPEVEIAVAAYLIWMRAGEPHGWDPNHWFMAIEDLLRARVGAQPIHSSECCILGESPIATVCQ